MSRAARPRRLTPGLVDPERRGGQLRRAAAALGSCERLGPGRAELHESQLAPRSSRFIRSVGTRQSIRRPCKSTTSTSTGGPAGTPLGNIQLLGKISGANPCSRRRRPESAGELARRPRRRLLRACPRICPIPASRVSVQDERHRLRLAAVELGCARRLWWHGSRRVLRRAGFPLELSNPFDRRTPRANAAPRGWAPIRAPAASSMSSAAATTIANLFIADASFLPTSAAVNPALTIAALALRTGDHILPARTSAT